MPLIILNLHNALSGWQNIEPFLYGQMRDRQIIVIENGETKRFTQLVCDLRNQVRNTLFSKNIDHFSMLYLLRIPDHRTISGHRVSEQVKMIKREMIEPLARQGYFADHHLFLMVDHMERDDGWGRPQDAKVLLDWELDSFGFMDVKTSSEALGNGDQDDLTGALVSPPISQSPNEKKGDKPGFTQADLERLEALWAWDPNRFKGVTLDKNTFLDEIGQEIDAKKNQVVDYVRTRIHEIKVNVPSQFEQCDQLQVNHYRNGRSQGCLDLAKDQLHQQWDNIRKRFEQEFAARLTVNDEVIRDNLPRQLLEHILKEEISIHGHGAIFFRLEIKKKPPKENLRGYLELAYFLNTLALLVEDGRVGKFAQTRGKHVFKVSVDFSNHELEEMLVSYYRQMAYAKKELEVSKENMGVVKVKLHVPKIVDAGRTSSDVHLAYLEDYGFFRHVMDEQNWNQWQGELQAGLNRAYHNLELHKENFLNEVRTDKEKDEREDKINILLQDCKAKHQHYYSKMFDHEVPLLEPIQWEKFHMGLTRKALSLIYARPRSKTFWKQSIWAIVLFTLPMLLYVGYWVFHQEGGINSWGFLAPFFLGSTILASFLAGFIPVKKTNLKLASRARQTLENANRHMDKLVRNCGLIKNYLISVNQVECARINLNLVRAKNDEIERQKLEFRIHDKDLTTHQEKCRLWLANMGLTGKNMEAMLFERPETDWTAPTTENPVYQPNPEVPISQRTTVTASVNGAVWNIHSNRLRGIQRISFTEDPCYVGNPFYG